MINRSKSPTRLLRVLIWLLPAVFAHGAYAVDRLVPKDFSSIQAAIDAATNGDEVVVSQGTYTENLTLKSGVDVRGIETARTVVMPADSTQPVVSAGLVDDVRFGNFTLVGAQVGIDVVDSTLLQIVNIVIVSATQLGIRVDALSQTDILNVVFFDNAVAIVRATTDAQLTNCAFIGNTVTISSPLGGIDPGVNVDNGGFFENADLVVGGIDTGLGTDPRVADPRFVSATDRDFHLRAGSAFIDSGIGQDVIDATTADIGAYGGEFADAIPFPVTAPSVRDVSAASPPPYSVELTWDANLAYLVTNSANAGSYRVHYQQNQAGPPYAGTDAGNGSQPSPVEAGDRTTWTLTDLQPLAPMPVAPQLQTADARQNLVSLAWTGVAGASHYRVYWGVDSVNEASADVGNVTAYSVTGLDNGTSYQFAVSAFQQPVYHISVTALDNTQNQNESVFSAESTLAIGLLTESAQSNVLMAAPAVTVPYPDLPDKGCFVATAAFGADWHAEVLALRDFRDRFLLTNEPGRRFVDWYYRNGPKAAQFIDEHGFLKPVVRALLLPLVSIALLLLGASWPDVVASAMLAAILVGRRTMPVILRVMRRSSP